MKTLIKAITIAGVVVVLCGCLPRKKAVRDPEFPGRLAAEEGSSELFTPSSYIARPTVGLGSKYRDLLSPDSYCIWFTDEVAALKQESATEEGGMSANQLWRRIGRSAHS